MNSYVSKRYDPARCLILAPIAERIETACDSAPLFSMPGVSFTVVGTSGGFYSKRATAPWRHIARSTYRGTDDSRIAGEICAQSCAHRH
jgi:Zn-dependent M28 family amino/carboxypeptidase